MFENTTWINSMDLSMGVKRHQNTTDLLYLNFIALGFILLRRLLEKYVLPPIAPYLDLKDAKLKEAPSDEALESAYNVSNRWRHRQIQGLAKQLDLSEAEVRRWLRTKNSENELTKFHENCWKLLYYTCAFVGGCGVVWDKPWLWDSSLCWYDLHSQSVSRAIWWHFMLSWGFACSLFIRQFADVNRKDWMMTIHHIYQISAMYLSWKANLFRMFGLALVVHDCADVFLELGKIFRCLRFHRCLDATFVSFVICWVVTRLGIYPFWIMRSLFIEFPQIHPFVLNYWAYYILMTLSILLLLLHCAWTYFILKSVRKYLICGLIRDSRSDSEDDDI